MKLFTGIGFVFASAIACAMSPSSAQTRQAGPPDMATFIRMMRVENALNVGKPLPAGIQANNADGKPVDLRAALHGPTVLLRIEPDCAPCGQLLDHVRTHAAEYERTQHAAIAVLRVKDSGHASMSLPEGVLEFHAAGKLDDGFLAGQITPTAYFFDEDLRLVARRGGMTTPEAFLRFPAAR